MLRDKFIILILKLSLYRVDKLIFLILKTLFKRLLNISDKFIERFLKQAKLIFDDGFQKTLIPFVLGHASLDYLKKSANSAFHRNYVDDAIMFREIALIKSTNSTSSQIINEILNTNIFESSHIEFVEKGGFDNIGFLKVQSNSDIKLIGKIHKRYKTINQEAFFYNEILNHFNELVKFCPKLYYYYQSQSTFEILFIEEFDGDKMPDPSLIEMIVEAYESIDQIRYAYINRLTSNKINLRSVIVEDKYHSKKTVNYKIQLIKSKLNPKKNIDHLTLIELLNQHFLKNKLYMEIDPISDYTLQHGDFSCGTSDGWGNKIYSNGQLYLFDWANIRFTLRGMDLIKLLCTYLTMKEIYFDYLFNEKCYLSSLKLEIKYMLILECLTYYSCVDDIKRIKVFDSSLKFVTSLLNGDAYKIW